MSGVQPDFAQDKVSSDPLMADIMEREADAWMVHPQVLVHFVEQHGDQGGLPIVTVDDIGVFIGFEHELERGTAEKAEALGIILVAVKDPTVEEIPVMVRLDKEAFQTIHP